MTAPNNPVAVLQQRVAADPTDNEAWELMIRELDMQRGLPGGLEQLVAALQEVTSRYPSAGRYWQMFVDIELARGDLEAAVAVFGRCLVKCYNVGLWRSYISYIKLANASKGNDGQVEVMRAYEFVLDRLGHDSDAGTVWIDFIAFMAAAKPGTEIFKRLFEPEPGKEASKRALRLRELYLRALQVPSEALDQLWQDYEHFEQASAGRNSLTATRFVDDARPRYHASRDAWPPRRSHLAALERDALPWTPGTPVASGPRFHEQRALWRAYLSHEHSNPQGLERPALQARVNLAYQQALAPLGRCPEWWYEWAEAWSADHADGGRAHATAVLQQAREALPDAVVLAFALADQHEAAARTKEALHVYEGLVERMESGGESGGVAAEPGSAVWVQLMQFHQRSAPTIAEAQARTRRVFLSARKWPRCTWHVYAFHALMEWRQNRSLQPDKLDLAVKIVKNIFELGLRKPDIQREPRYVETFAEWLVGAAGDVGNARLLFQNTLADETVAKDPEMCAAFVRFEARHGTVGDVNTAEAAWRAALAAARASGGGPPSSTSSALGIQQRYCTFDLWPCTLQQRRHLEMVAADATPTPPPPDAMPTSVAHFISKLPPALEEGCPCPDVDLVIDNLLRTAEPPPALNGSTASVDRRGGSKEAEAEATQTRQGAAPRPSMADLFNVRQRVKLDSAS